MPDSEILTFRIDSGTVVTSHAKVIYTVVALLVLTFFVCAFNSMLGTLSGLSCEQDRQDISSLSILVMSQG